MKLIAGIRYGKWTTQPDPTDKKNHTVCKCDCGTIRPVYNSLLTGRYSNSCGCTKTRHGLSKHPLYRHWRDMRYRCNNLPEYADISYPPEWDDPAVFIAEVEQLTPRFRKGLSLDRKNLRLNYSLGNCRWATKKQQSENRRNSIFLHSKYGTFTLSEWHRTFNLLRGRKKTLSLPKFKTALETVNHQVDYLLASLRMTDDQLQNRVDEYQKQVMIDCLRGIGLTDEQIAGYLAEIQPDGTAQYAEEQTELVPA